MTVGVAGTGGWRQRTRRFRAVTVVGATALAASLAAVGGTASSAQVPLTTHATAGCGSFPKGEVTVAVFAPFSGPNAGFGSHGIFPGVSTGAYEVNHSGGICGHHIKVITSDSTSDAADAIPNAYQLASSHPNAIFGLDSVSAPQTARIFSENHIGVFTTAGTVQLSAEHLPYVWQTYPPDSVESFAMVAGALTRNEKTAVIAFGNDSGSQDNVPYIESSYTKNGGKVLANIQLTPDLPSYSVEVQKIVALHPQVIFNESDPQTTATLFAELQQSKLGLKTPTIFTSLDPSISQALASAIHQSYGQMGKWLTTVIPQTSSTEIYQLFLRWFKAAHPGELPFNGYNAAHYDGINIMALAMYEAKTSDPTVYNKYITKVTNNPSNRHCSTYGACLKLLKRGVGIYYDGAAGSHIFNAQHWATGDWALAKPTTGGAAAAVELIDPTVLAKYADVKVNIP